MVEYSWYTVRHRFRRDDHSGFHGNGVFYCHCRNNLSKGSKTTATGESAALGDTGLNVFGLFDLKSDIYMENGESFSGVILTAGCDEAGRGALAGFVFAAAVILPAGYTHSRIRDSKVIAEKERYRLAEEIRHDAITWGVGSANVEEIDQLNILNATYLAMHRAIDALSPPPEFLLIDGNRFNGFGTTPHQCLIRGDSRCVSIAAASILAKTSRDAHMLELNELYPQYFWNMNKGYGTRAHTEALRQNGRSPFHRRTFHVKAQLKLVF
jgi:ribonuclease HII